jgi:soluble lytic murein transglycosylase-like protein
MQSRLLRIVALAALGCVALPAVASAQLYTWRDAAGNLVVSATPREGAAQTFDVVNVREGIRSTTQPSQALNRRAREYEPLIEAYSTHHQVRPDLVRAVIQAESAFNPLARSVKGAMGLMQLMPATARQLGVQDPWDPAENIRGGIAYLRSLLDRYSNNEELALAAYNAGPGAVERYGTVPPYRETRNYVAKITRQANSPPPIAPVERKVEKTVDGREVVRLVTAPASKSPKGPGHRDNR